MQNNYDYFYYHDKPISYKNILIHPVRVVDYIPFYYCIDCLLINKNRIPDIKIIQMTYLEYICFEISNVLNSGNIEGDDSKIVTKFFSLISLIFKIDMSQMIFVPYGNSVALLISDYKIGEDDEPYNVIIDSDDFDEIKRIICEYHLIELPDENLDPKLEQVLQEAMNFRNKNNEKMGSLEDQFVCVMISTSLKLEDIEKLTIRKFQKILERVDHKLHYQLYKTAEMNGCEFKSKIHHWMSEIKHDKYAGLMVDYDSTFEKFKK